MVLIPSKSDDDESGSGCVASRACCSGHCTRKICCSGASRAPCAAHDASPSPLRRLRGSPSHTPNPQSGPSSPAFRSDSGFPGNACQKEIIITAQTDTFTTSFI